MLGNNWHKKEMPLVSLAGMGGGLSSPAFLASLILNITKPTVFSPLDDSGVPDFTYNALSSEITDVTTSSINLTGTSGSFIPGSYVKDANSTIIPSDIASVDGSTINFSSAVDLTSVTAPLEMVDASGNPVAPTTSNVTTATSIPGGSLSSGYMFNYADGATTNGWPRLVNVVNVLPTASIVKGDRMLWIKSDNGSNNVISDSVVLNGRLLYTDSRARDTVVANPGPSGQDAIEFGEQFTRLPYGSAALGTRNGDGEVYANEIGVSPGLLDIVTWTGDGSTPRSISHNLGTAPGMIIVKCINQDTEWVVFHKDLPNNQYGYRYHVLNEETAGLGSVDQRWVGPFTDQVFTVGNDININYSGYEYVAYVFAS